jgi:hypothetical protein
LLYFIRELKRYYLIISKLLQITGIINRNFKSTQVQNHTTLKIHHTLALPTVLYRCGTWATKEQDKPRITTAETKFVMKTAECIWHDYKNSGDILSELKINSVAKKIQN